MTLPPRPGKRNERFRDLVDLLLLESLVEADYAALRDACEVVFANRKTHPWPPDLDVVPSHWEDPFTQLADEMQLAEREVAAALARIRALVDRILAGR